MAGLKQWIFGPKAGAAPVKAGDASAAQAAIRQAEALIEEGNRREDRGELASALDLYREAARVAPDLARAYVNIGNALQLLGSIDEAIVAQRTALRLAADNPPAHYNLGVLLARTGDAAGAEQELREALHLRPAMTDARIVLSDVLEESGRVKEAEAELRCAVAGNPQSLTAAHNLALLLQKSGRLDDAEDAILDARSRVADCTLLDVDLASLCVATGRAREAEPLYRKALATADSMLPAAGGLLFSLNCRDDVDADFVFREHGRLGSLFGAVARRAAPFVNAPDPDRSLRVGYVSGDLRQHPVGLFVRPVLAHHDPDAFEVHCYANHRSDDEFTRTLKALAPHWHPIAALDDAAVAAMVRRDAIDILVDLSGHTTDSRPGVFAGRAAPIQVTWLGYLNTTGLESMDYRICDRHTDPAPEADHLHTERLYRLPNSQWCYDPVHEVATVAQPHPDVPDALIFGSFNQFAKISDACLALWASVLARLPDARLRVFAVPEGRTRARFLDHLGRLGIASSRVSLHGRLGILEYFAAIGDVDVAFDTFPYNGATTTLDTLWMGVPIVALRGSRAIARGSFSIVSTLGVPELLAMTPEEYVEKCVRLASDRDLRTGLRRSLRGRLESSPLMDAAAFVRDLEHGYREMWQAWCRGASEGAARA